MLVKISHLPMHTLQRLLGSTAYGGIPKELLLPAFQKDKKTKKYVRQHQRNASNDIRKQKQSQTLVMILSLRSLVYKIT